MLMALLKFNDFEIAFCESLTTTCLTSMFGLCFWRLIFAFPVMNALWKHRLPATTSEFKSNPESTCAVAQWQAMALLWSCCNSDRNDVKNYPMCFWTLQSLRAWLTTFKHGVGFDAREYDTVFNYREMSTVFLIRFHIIHTVCKPVIWWLVLEIISDCSSVVHDLIAQVWMNDVKAMVHLKIDVLLSFTHHHVIPSLYVFLLQKTQKIYFKQCW